MITVKLFLLSFSEAKNYLPDRISRLCKYKGEDVWWWLRSLGNYKSNTAIVSTNGYVSRYGIDVSDNDGAVRPALHLNPVYLKSLKHTEKDCVLFAGREWLVLNEERGLLLSKEAVAQHHFDEECNNYEQSEIKTYLNGELLNKLFTEDEQKLIMDTTIDGEESCPFKLIGLAPANRSDLISRKVVLSTLKNVFDEYGMSYGEQYKGFAEDVPKAIKDIPAFCVACEPEYLGENHLIGCRNGRCCCGNIVKSFQHFCDACGIQLKWGNVWGQN